MCIGTFDLEFTIINIQLLMVMEKFNLFKYLLMGGHDEKLKNFGKSKK